MDRIGQPEDRRLGTQTIDQIIQRRFGETLVIRFTIPGCNERAQNPHRLRRPGDIRLVGMPTPGGCVIAPGGKAEGEGNHVASVPS